MEVKLQRGRTVFSVAITVLANTLKLLTFLAIEPKVFAILCLSIKIRTKVVEVYNCNKVKETFKGCM